VPPCYSVMALLSEMKVKSLPRPGARYAVEQENRQAAGCAPPASRGPYNRRLPFPPRKYREIPPAFMLFTLPRLGVIDVTNPARKTKPGKLNLQSSLLSIPPDPVPAASQQVYNLESCTARMTDQLRKKLQEEVDALEHELVHELPKEIKRAAALGDLSENAEYHMAKQRQEFVKARFRQLGKRLADLSLTNMNNIPRDKVGLGSTVKVYDSTKNEEIEYKLVTSEESDVGAGKISTTSPIGRALLNKKVGDEATVITPNGKRELEILSLITVHDETDREKAGA
jgi:transcription elongation factor GreA